MSTSWGGLRPWDGEFGGHTSLFLLDDGQILDAAPAVHTEVVHRVYQKEEDPWIRAADDGLAFVTILSYGFMDGGRSAVRLTATFGRTPTINQRVALLRMARDIGARLDWGIDPQYEMKVWPRNAQALRALKLTT